MTSSGVRPIKAKARGGIPTSALGNTRHLAALAWQLCARSCSGSTMNRQLPQTKNSTSGIGARVHIRALHAGQSSLGSTNATYGTG